MSTYTATFDILKEMLPNYTIDILGTMNPDHNNPETTVHQNDVYVGHIVLENGSIYFYGASTNKTIVSLADPNCFNLITRAIRHEQNHNIHKS